MKKQAKKTKQVKQLFCCCQKQQEASNDGAYDIIITGEKSIIWDLYHIFPSVESLDGGIWGEGVSNLGRVRYGAYSTLPP